MGDLAGDGEQVGMLPATGTLYAAIRVVVDFKLKLKLKLVLVKDRARGFVARTAALILCLLHSACCHLVVSGLMNSENAVAGPSSLANSILPFLPPAGAKVLLFCLTVADARLGPPCPTAHFTSTEDLLARFHLVSSYDKYVRPFVDDGSADKGKGKERDISPSPEPTPAGAMDVDDDDDDKRKKRNNYRHLIKGVPGVCAASVPATRVDLA